MRRTLALKKETLTELTTGELGGVAGAQATPACPTVAYCVSFSRCVVDAVSDAMRPCPWEPTAAC